MNWLFWAPLGAASAHIFEEFVWPGGFSDWDRSHRPAFQKSITPRFHVFINGMLLLFCVSVGINGRVPVFGVAEWLTLAALLASNTVFHIVGTVQSKRYSPGMLTGVCFYLPLAAYGYVHFLRNGGASIATALGAAILGGSYHLWAFLAHARRSGPRVSL
jgi:Protein of unknown function with HXXEE motif